ncbi:sugar phosphate isomerase/epimerase family protein [Lichenicoccus sp.]|uniref:sugar phosphate isomerase/epimerase family protein n=1 Tax=Lichenicoccus sp. TaxID=2781899 RepID=UPI003D1440AF
MRRLAVSNLAWRAGPAMQARALASLARQGAAGVEVAPTRIADWDAITPQHLVAFRAACRAEGLAVSSLQAIFHLCPEAALLGSAAAFAAMQEQVRRIAGIAASLGAGVAVFGAPQRRLRGAMAPPLAMQLAADRLRLLAELAYSGGVVLGIEPVPASYGADFLNHAHEVIDLVRRVDHPAVRVHLDTACITLAGDDPARAIMAAGSLLAHYHMAEPRLGGFLEPALDHAGAARALDAVGYAGWVVLEMLAPASEAGDDEAELGAIAAALACARSAGA